MLSALPNVAGCSEPLGMDTATLSDKAAILVVDDDCDLLKLLSDILTGQGYRVNVADSGEKALASVAANPPELILLDIMMPGLNGYDVLGCLKDQDASCDIPIIFLSALNGTTQRVKGLKLGAMDFVSKPFQAEELLARVQTHLEAHRLRLRVEQQRDELCSALAQVKVLSGFLPICAHCKKIRDDDGSWNQIETYIQEHSGAMFSHGICPGCTQEFFAGHPGE
jgi:PleD family two-component response regulator